MKKLTIIVLVLLSLFVVACAAPPSDVAPAQVVEKGDSQVVAEKPVVEEVKEDSAGIAPTTSVAIDSGKSVFEFEGYAVGKSHVGTFDVWSGTLTYDSLSNIEGITGVIDATSVNTGIGGLDGHLQNEDFFEVETYPEILFETVSLTADEIVADLTFRGVTKTISFPAQVSNEAVVADFLLDTTDFNIKYTGVNKEVRISFNFVPAE